MKNNKGFWERRAKRYDATMKKDRAAYEHIAGKIKQRLNRSMTVLELTCGTGILSERLAGSVKMLEATDFSEEMIREAKKHPSSMRLHYSVQDATDLPYAAESFDAVVISNALHIMPEPEKALTEIRRVLKRDGVLFAPTFTASGSLFGRIKIRIMELSGFRVFHKWTPDAYLGFLQNNGFTVTDSEIFGGALTLTYTEAKKEVV
jgi:ubiquinone/menaquinone biosynthesis C-methylase UbiE